MPCGQNVSTVIVSIAEPELFMEAIKVNECDELLERTEVIGKDQYVGR